jgi:serine/threonine protein kinase
MVGRIFLGRYQATRLLGEGGMGRVYLARQLDLGRPVVVKVMHEHVAKDPKFCERFQKETLLMARFQHPYVVTLYDASLDDPDGPCIVMEYVRGLTLDVLLERNGRLSPARIGRLLSQFCEALQAAHSQGIIHRDLKPANLMVVEADSPYEKIKVMDFGLATLLNGPNLHNADFAVGTPGYMCPEQVKGLEVDHRGDLYSVGIILYELLTGKMPFSGRSSMEIMLAHVNLEPRTFAEIGAEAWIPPAIESVVRACISKEPSQRPQYARELAEMYLDALTRQDEETQVTNPGTTPPPGADSNEDPIALDSNSVVHEIEAWMPEAIAAHKLRGFVDDVGGRVLESGPGLIRVQLGGSVYAPRPKSALGWLGIKGKPLTIEVELHLRRSGQEKDGHLSITIAVRSPEGYSPADPEWRMRCDHIFCDLRGYLMGSSSSLNLRDAVGQ